MNSDLTILKRIAHYLMLCGSFTENIGLLDGKMGMAIFFYNYGRRVKDKMFEDFGGVLIDEIYDDIHLSTPISFGNGLCGIAWGLMYLMQENFVEAEVDEVFEEIDKQIVRLEFRDSVDYSLKTGCEGIARYIIYRCKNGIRANSAINPIFLERLHENLSKSTNKKNAGLINALDRIMNGKRVEGNCTDLLKSLSVDIEYDESDIFNETRPLGILDNGYTGIGLKLLEKEA